MAGVISFTLLKTLFGIAIFISSAIVSFGFEEADFKNKFEILLKNAELKGQYSGGFLVSKDDKVIYIRCGWLCQSRMENS